MAKRQTTSATAALASAGVDLHLEPRGPRVRAGLSAALREAVRSGRLAAGTRLPSSRALADDLGIARSTVTESYAELVAEGWLSARHGSGTRVAERAEPRRTESRRAESRRAESRRTEPADGLEPGASVYAEFPRAPWLAAARRAFAVASHSSFGYGDPLGLMALRVALAEYLARVRGVYAEPAQVVITSGFHHGLGVVARALAALGTDTVAVESYGLDIYRAVLGDEGMRTPWLGVDEQGARIEDLLERADVGAVLLTPAHQFPTGFALSSTRRSAVLDWARRRGAFVLEDDYDGEFRYDRRPIGALQGVDPDHVVYFGTASKSIAPALRLAWMVVPRRLSEPVAAAKGRVDTVSVLDQLIFAEFVTSGAFDRHVRGRRQNYRRRRDELVEAVGRSASGVRVVGLAAGLQAVLTLPAGTEATVRRAAAEAGLVVSGLDEFRHPSAPESAGRDALVVNFSAVSDSAWAGALRRLVRVLP